MAVGTGGNAGIGLGYATGLAKCGSHVWIFGRRPEQSEAAAAELTEPGARVHALSVDVSQEDQVMAATAEAAAESGRLDTLVSNAGFKRSKPLLPPLTTSFSVVVFHRSKPAGQVE